MEMLLEVKTSKLLPEECKKEIRDLLNHKLTFKGKEIGEIEWRYEHHAKVWREALVWVLGEEK